MQDGKKLAYYFMKYSGCLQSVVKERTGNFYHDNEKKPVRFVYLCPLCTHNTIAYLKEDDLRFWEGFNLDHFPPASVGGKNTIMVCNKCNSKAGKDFDYSLKEWINDKSAVQGILGTKIPVQVSLETVSGKYKANLVINGPNSFAWEMGNYPLLQEGFDRIAKNNEKLIQTITWPTVSNELAYKAILKAAYLYAFSIWGYDFAISHIGKKFRGVIFNNEKHILSNSGIFFHMKPPFPPEGLCYVFKPSELQCFMINLKLIDLRSRLECFASVLIPGPELANWEAMAAYQPIIDKQMTFQNAFIKLPENTLSDTNHYPYTATWNSRSGFRIQGEE